MTPASALRCLTIMATPGVETISRSITSMPEATRAATAASRTQAPLGRESRPKTILKCLPSAGAALFFSQAAKAEAICEITAGVSVPPMVPRIPETPIISASMRLLHHMHKAIVPIGTACLQAVSVGRDPNTGCEQPVPPIGLEARGTIRNCPLRRQGISFGHDLPAHPVPVRLYERR